MLHYSSSLNFFKEFDEILYDVSNFTEMTTAYNDNRKRAIIELQVTRMPYFES